MEFNSYVYNRSTCHLSLRRFLPRFIQRSPYYVTVTEDKTAIPANILKHLVLNQCGLVRVHVDTAFIYLSYIL
jgi:hypothetical protein